MKKERGGIGTERKGENDSWSAGTRKTIRTD